MKRTMHKKSARALAIWATDIDEDVAQREALLPIQIGLNGQGQVFVGPLRDAENRPSLLEFCEKTDAAKLRQIASRLMLAADYIEQWGMDKPASG